MAAAAAELRDVDLSVALAAPPRVTLLTVPPRVSPGPGDALYGRRPCVLVADPSGLLLVQTSPPAPPTPRGHTPPGSQSASPKPPASKKKRVEGMPSKNLMAERRRRRKRLNDRLSMLRSVVPKISKMDRTAILGDTIDYMKELLERIRQLQEEMEQQQTPGALSGNYSSVIGVKILLSGIVRKI